MSILRKFNEFKEAPSYAEPEMPTKETESNKPWVDEGKNLADMLGVDYQGGKINFQGKEIMFASETYSFILNGKNTKIESAEEMKDFLESGKSIQSQAQSQMQESRRFKR